MKDSRDKRTVDFVKTRGGYREGSGRKPNADKGLPVKQTKVIRVPIEKLPEIESILIDGNTESDSWKAKYYEQQSELQTASELIKSNKESSDLIISNQKSLIDSQQVELKEARETIESLRAELEGLRASEAVETLPALAPEVKRLEMPERLQIGKSSWPVALVQEAVRLHREGKNGGEIWETLHGLGYAPLPSKSNMRRTLQTWTDYLAVWSM
jgi:predicted RNase H-like nuclease (RuvC/YqgF family)